MRLRKDALQVATHIMQEVVAIAGRSEEGRGTVGRVQVYPNSRNVVPGEVTFSIDMRNLSDALVDEMDRQLREFIGKIERESGLAVALKEVSHYPAAPFHAECQAAIAAAAQRLGYPAREIVSGAGHDAVYMSYLAPHRHDFYPLQGRHQP
ncbi:N-carbamoyl-L-amino acid hydrolase [Raoultella terrigena]|uniref:N-carbamoyl-L-amino acid hydrolase n=1 Tax=Raoultella terrigena TaxID=577 RepID=A0A3P8M4Y1_RAOTE|nr:N-carbamoyl-L-amino acid hydrolase [Raoultella terrigena]